MIDPEISINLEHMFKNHIELYYNEKICCRVLGCIVVIVLIMVLRKAIAWYKTNKKIKKKRNEVNIRKSGLFQKFKGMMLPFDNVKKICHLSGSDIHKKICSGELTAVDVLEAYQTNTLIKNEEMNFLSDIIYEADVSSLMVDPEDKLEVMGFPLSVSDSLSVEKYDCTFGLQRESFCPAPKDSVIIKVLRNQGAIPSIIASVGQAELITDSTSNPITGRTLNPLNKNMSCGGSSGGLAVSLATESALIGIGSDSKGNMRIPASFCGVYCLKPTSGRISRRHKKIIGHKQNLVEDSIGPMARNVDDLVATFRAMVSRKMYELDPTCPPVPFQEELLSTKKPLKIGYYIDISGGENGKRSSEMRPIPAIERAVLMAKEALEKAGHEVVEFHLPRTELVNKIFTKIMFSDAGKSLTHDLLKSGPIDSSIKSLVCWLKLPRFIKRALGCVTGVFCRTVGYRLSGLAGVSSVSEMWKLNDSIKDYKEEVLASWEHSKLDGLICPVLPIVAPSLRRCNGCLTNDNVYAVIYNILDYAAGAIPITKVTQSDIDNLRQSYSTKSKCCNQIAQKHCDNLNMPVGIQCVALPWREEIVLRLMKNITDNL